MNTKLITALLLALISGAGLAAHAAADSPEDRCYRAVRLIVDRQAPDTKPAACEGLSPAAITEIKYRAFFDAVDAS